MFGLNGYVTFRDEMRHGRFTINSRDELVECLESSALSNCLICTHSPIELSLGILSIVFLDIDIEKDLNLAKKVALKASRRIEREFGVKPLILFSGFKGYHVIILLKPKEIPGGPSEAREYLKFLQHYLSYGYCDKQLLGDVNRLFRIPYTLNSKIVDGPRLVSNSVVVIQEWDGERADPALLYGNFKIWEKSCELKRAKEPTRIRFKRGEGRRALIQELIGLWDKGVNINYDSFQALLRDFVNEGWGEKELNSWFSRYPKYDTEAKYQIRYALEHRPKLFTNQHLLDILRSAAQ